MSDELIVNTNDRVACLIYNKNSKKWYNLIEYKTEIKKDYMTLTLDGYEAKNTIGLTNEMKSALMDYMLSAEQIEAQKKLDDINKKISERYGDLDNLKIQADYNKMKKQIERFKRYYDGLIQFVDDLDDEWEDD